MKKYKLIITTTLISYLNANANSGQSITQLILNNNKYNIKIESLLNNDTYELIKKGQIIGNKDTIKSSTETTLPSFLRVEDFYKWTEESKKSAQPNQIKTAQYFLKNLSEPEVNGESKTTSQNCNEIEISKATEELNNAINSTEATETQMPSPCKMDKININLFSQSLRNAYTQKIIVISLLSNKNLANDSLNYIKQSLYFTHNKDGARKSQSVDFWTEYFSYLTTELLLKQKNQPISPEKFLESNTHLATQSSVLFDLSEFKKLL